MDTIQNLLQGTCGIVGLAIISLFIFIFLFFIKSGLLDLKEKRYKAFLQKMRDKQIKEMEDKNL